MPTPTSSDRRLGLTVRFMSGLSGAVLASNE
jgi:hypothetical protein